MIECGSSGEDVSVNALFIQRNWGEILLQWGHCIVNAYCRFYQQACTNFMQTYLYSLISTHFWLLTTNLHWSMPEPALVKWHVFYKITTLHEWIEEDFKCKFSYILSEKGFSFFRDIEQLNTLDNEEAGLALLSELLDLGLSNDVPEAPKILPNNVVDVLRESGEFKTFLRLATKLNVLETLQQLPQGNLLRGIDNKTVRRWICLHQFSSQ